MDDEDILTYVDYAKLTAIQTCYDLIEWVGTITDPAVLNALVLAGTAPPQAFYEAQIANTVVAFADYAAVASGDTTRAGQPQPHVDHVIQIAVDFDRASSTMQFTGATIADGVVSARELAYLERADFDAINVRLDIDMHGDTDRDNQAAPNGLDGDILRAYKDMGSRVYGQLLLPASGAGHFEERRFWQVFARILGFDLGTDDVASEGVVGAREHLRRAGSLADLGVPLVTRGAKIGPFDAEQA